MDGSCKSPILQKKPQKLNRRQARWLMELQEFHFKLHYITGKANSKADILSRRPGFEKGVNDNDNIIVLPKILFHQVVQTLPTNLITTHAFYEQLLMN
jgi:hypothetical protein